MNSRQTDATSARPPWWLAAGFVLTLGMWVVNWQRGSAHLATPWGFFWLWLGYIFTVDGLVAWRTGSSPLQRSPRRMLGLFLASIPAWWLFEYLNIFVKNWIYLGVEVYSPLEFFLYSTLSFTTVIPAVFETAELLASIGPLRRLGAPLANGPRLPASPSAIAGWICAGLCLLGAVILLPRQFYPFTWICVILILDPLNYLLGWRSLTARMAKGDWRWVGLLGASALTCGFFWEMWNLHSYPKWIYDIPFACEIASGRCPIFRIFEMPWLGYGGYLPFGVEVYAIYHFVAGLAGRPQPHFLTFDRGEGPSSPVVS